MRVLAITRVHHLLADNKLLRAEALVEALVHVVGDHGVIGRGVLVGLDHQVASELDTVCLLGDSVQNHRVVRHIGDDQHAVKVLCRRTHHSRPADVDVFDDVVKIVRLFDRRLEGVEVDTDQIDRLDAELFGLIEVRLLVASVQDAAVDIRVQRLDAPLKTLGKLCHLIDLDRRDTCFF